MINGKHIMEYLHEQTEKHNKILVSGKLNNSNFEINETSRGEYLKLLKAEKWDEIRKEIKKDLQEKIQMPELEVFYMAKFGGISEIDLQLKRGLLNEVGIQITKTIPELIKSTQLEQIQAHEGAKSGQTVAVGDIHGGFTQLLIILKTAGLIDNEGNWSGKNKTLVQVGDLVDRGPNSWETFEYMLALQNQARDLGGDVRLCIGNHELYYLDGGRAYKESFTIGNHTEFKSILGSEILEGKFELVVDDKNHNVIFVHASFDKFMKELFVLEKMEEQYQNNPCVEEDKNVQFKKQLKQEVDMRYEDYLNMVYSQDDNSEDGLGISRALHEKLKSLEMGKVSNKQLDIWMQKNQLGNKDISAWANKHFLEYAKAGVAQDYPRDEHSSDVTMLMVWQRLNYNKLMKKERIDNFVKISKPQRERGSSQELVICGHNTTDSGKIKKDGKYIFIDTGITRAIKYPSYKISFITLNDNGAIRGFESDFFSGILDWEVRRLDSIKSLGEEKKIMRTQSKCDLKHLI